RPLAFSGAANAREVCWTVRMSRSCSQSQSASGAWSSGWPPRQPPTRWTSASTAPKRSVSAAAHARVASSSSRSTTRASIWSDGNPSRPATSSRRPWSTSVSASRAPSCASALATVGPSPPAAPAIATTRPSSRFIPPTTRANALRARDCDAVASRRRRPGGLHLRLELQVEHRQRELVLADEVDPGARIALVAQRPAAADPLRRGGRRDIGRDELVGGDPVRDLRAVDARAIELLDGLAQRGHAVGHALPLDGQPVVGPVHEAVLVQVGEQQLAAEAVVVAHARAGDREAEQTVAQDGVLDVPGEAQPLDGPTG